MARKAKEFTIKRNEILEAAQRLVRTKGYEQMTIQDILEALQISKGAFYYYFNSKQDLLDAMIGHMIDAGEQFILPIIQDPELNALEKLKRYFDTVASWKNAQRDYLIAIMRVWYADHNAIVRQKMTMATLQRFLPNFTEIVHQGMREGLFTPRYPDQVGEVVMALLQSMGDTLAHFILFYDPQRDNLAHIEGSVMAYTDALERVLGAPPGSIHLFDLEILKDWVA
jgi:TetR/AcrR family transcriptional repressor of nem operon